MVKFNVTQVGSKVNSDKIRSFIVDKLVDIAALPTQTKCGESGLSVIDDLVDAGSTCLCIEDSSVWMLSNAGTWEEL